MIGNPDKIICVGLNYEEHRVETGRPKSTPSDTSCAGPTRRSAICADGEATRVRQGRLRGRACGDHWEGRPKHQRERRRGAYRGYSCYNEGSVREYQRHASQWTPGKNFPGTGAFGPFLVTPDEVGELAGKKIQTRLNGNVEQSSTLDMMIYGPLKLIEYLSSFTPLSPGDVIVSGTPGGVGWVRKPPLWMKPGDVVEVEIDGVGLLRNPIVAED